MLFHITVDHTAESCPLVTNSPEKMMTSEGAKKAGVKVILALGGRAEHRAVYVVDTDEVDKLYEFLSPALSWAKCDIAPVRELDF